MKIVVYQDLRGEWRWRFVAENGRVMADGAEGYDEKRGVDKALDTICGALRTGDVDRVTK
jgi:uncharacterized protein YegP (UPF0339 family)